MTGKELKRMSRSELIEIIYRYEHQSEEWKAEKQQMEDELNDRRIRVSRAGSVAEAALELNGVFEAAQKAADQYLAEIQAVNADTEGRIQQMLADAQQKADVLVQQGQKSYAELKERGETEYAEKMAQAEAEGVEIRTHAMNILSAHEELKVLLTGTTNQKAEEK